jgi:N-acetylglutamate synthase/N-acetylornithine aminotransferase
MCTSHCEERASKKKRTTITGRDGLDGIHPVMATVLRAFIDCDADSVYHNAQRELDSVVAENVRNAQLRN